MAFRFGNDYLIEIKGESTYGAVPAFTDGATVLPDIVEMKPSCESITVRRKTPGRDPHKNTILSGRRSGKVTMKGEMTPDHQVLLAALTGTTTSPYGLSASHVPPSYTIRQYFAADKKGHQATGCVLESLKITGEGNKPLQYEAVWRARVVTSEEDFTTDGGGSVSAIDTKPFLFADVSEIALFDGNYADLTCLTLTLGNEFCDDDASFQTGLVRKRELLAGFTGELAIETLYDGAVWNNAGWLEDHLLSDSPLSADFSFIGAVKTWEWSLTGKIAEVSPADPDNQLFILSATMKLAGDSTNPAFRVAVTNS
jgi:hypothetical protein